jgi:transcription factor E2F2
MRSTHGEIEVFLCPDDPGTKAPLPSSYTTTMPTKTTTTPQSPVSKSSASSSMPSEFLIHNSGDVKVEPVPTTEDCLSSEQMLSALSSAGMRDALLCESDDFGLMGGGRLQLQTEDQHLPAGNNISLSFLPLFGFYYVRLVIADR